MKGEAPGVRCFPISADVRNYEAMSNAIDRVLQEFGRIDILINSAAGNFLCPPEKLSYNAFKSVMEIGMKYLHLLILDIQLISFNT